MENDIPKNPLRFGYYLTMFHKKWALLALLFVVLATAIDRSPLLILRNLTDAISTKPLNYHSIWFWAILYPLVLLAAHFCWRGSGYSGMHWFLGIRKSGYQTLYDYLTLHSKEFFNNRFAGTLTNKIGHAVDGTEMLLEKGLWNFLQLVIGLFLYIGFAWNADYRLGLIIVVWVTFFVSLNIFFAHKLQPRSYKSAEALSTLKGRIVDSLSNVSLVHEYANFTSEQKYIGNFIKKHYQKAYEHWHLSETFLMINGVLIFLFLITMISTSIYLFSHGIISIGTVIMIVTIVSFLYSQFLFMGQELRDAATYFGEAKEGLSEILQEHVITDAKDAREVKIQTGEIAIDQLNFQYEEKQIFENFSLHIPAGQKVGLVGRSGAGKTTFVSLLLRHYDINGGEITIDKQNITGITLASLRRAIAFVPQDTSLFHRSIRENISYSNPEATEDEIKKAAELSQADGFIQDLPRGYDTLVGERGVRLSGGQRQRIAIARAFLKNAPIVIFDEATSSLDSQSEGIIQDAIEKLMKNRTVIAIAHRLSTLKKMDRIVVIEHGKIVEDGLPEELLKKPHGQFKTMWEHQINGFIIDE